jgi:hypothetical protein
VYGVPVLWYLSGQPIGVFMAMFQAGVTQGSVLSTVQTKFNALRFAATQIAELGAWANGVAVADLVALGFSNADANTILSAITESQASVTAYNANSVFQKEVMGP